MVRLAGLWNLVVGTLTLTGGAATEQWLGLHGDTVRLFGSFWLILGAVLLTASADPLRHWLSILTAAASKLIVQVVLFAFQLPSDHAAGWWMLAATEIGWTFALGVVLAAVEKQERHCRLVSSPEIVKMALRAKTQHGVSLYELSVLGPTMVVFLRQLGCPFCRESLADLANQRKQIEAQGTTITLVHMAEEPAAAKALECYGLQDLPRVRDPGQSLYRAFGLPTGKIMQIFDLRSIVRLVPLMAKYGTGKVQGDGLQMPGVFVIFHGEVLKAFRHQSVADRPDYVSLASEQDYPIAS